MLDDMGTFRIDVEIENAAQPEFGARSTRSSSIPAPRWPEPGSHGVIPALYVVRNPMNRATSVMSRAVNRMVCASTRSTPGR